jgi:ABC-2 type transport system ATP-binding protein
MNPFELRNVTKIFKGTTALDNVSLVARGPEIIGLVGRNGSGKTTLLRHISGLYLPTSGECVTFGKPSGQLGAEELRKIGVMNQHDKFIEWMRAAQFIDYISSFYTRWDRDLQSYLTQLLDVDLNSRLNTMSPGNLQKVGLIVAVCHHPDLLLLDEPLSDLDPVARGQVVQLLLERFSTDTMTIVISSHMLQDIERIVERIVFLDKGRVVADSSLDDLKSKYSASLDELFPVLAGGASQT